MQYSTLLFSGALGRLCFPYDYLLTCSRVLSPHQAKEEEEERKKREEELKAQQELELFQRKFAAQGRKKQREPKVQHTNRQKSVWEKYSTQILVVGGFAALFGLMTYVVVTNLEEN